jgi:hypothetical protein
MRDIQVLQGRFPAQGEETGQRLEARTIVEAVYCTTGPDTNPPMYKFKSPTLSRRDMVRLGSEDR